MPTPEAPTQASAPLTKHNYLTTISATKFPLLTTQDKDKAYYYRDKGIE